MDSKKGKSKKGLITKTWERCKSIGRGTRKTQASWESQLGSRSKSCPSLDLAAMIHDDDDKKQKKKKKKKKKNSQVTPEGCFSVYVGAERQRFVIKTEYLNHPLFKMLLEEAESEYGYNSQGPIMLPCEVHVFYKVLTEIDEPDQLQPHGCAFRRIRSPSNHNHHYHLFPPSPFIALNNF